MATEYNFPQYKFYEGDVNWYQTHNDFCDALELLSSDITAKYQTIDTAAGIAGLSDAAQYIDNRLLKYNVSPTGSLVCFKTESGQETWFYAIPKFQIEDLRPDGVLGTGTHPAFIHENGEYDILYIGAYMATMKNNEIVCQPNQVPRSSRTLEEEIAECAATEISGISAGSLRLMSVWDRSAVNLWISANVAAGNPEPAGNTAYGKSHLITHIRGIGSTWTKTGTMGAPANHNGESHGIADFVGNLWEREDGMYLQDGEIFLAANNDPFNLANPDSTSHWFSSSNTSGNGVISIVTDASAVVRNGTIGDDSHSNYDSRGGSTGFASIPGASSQQLKLAGITPIGDSTDLSGASWVRTYGRRAPLVGGNWNYGASAGCAALELSSTPLYRHGSSGFRPAFAI